MDDDDAANITGTGVAIDIIQISAVDQGKMNDLIAHLEQQEGSEYSQVKTAS